MEPHSNKRNKRGKIKGILHFLMCLCWLYLASAFVKRFILILSQVSVCKKLVNLLLCYSVVKSHSVFSSPATNLSWCSEKRVWSGHSSFWSGPLPSMRVSTLVLLRQGDHLPSCHLQWPQGHHSQLPPSWVPKRKTKWLSLSPCHEKFRLFCTITSVDSVHSTHLPDRSKLLNTGTLNLCAKTYTSGNTAKVQGQISSQVTVENGRHL